MAVSQEQARAELARRELARRELARRESDRRVVSLDGSPSKDAVPAYGGKTGALRFGMGGFTGYGSAPGSEDILPMAGQTAGAMIPGVNTFGGSVAGAAAGQAARQAIRGARGQKIESPIDLETMMAGPVASKGPIRNDVLATAAGEGIARGIGKIAKPVANRLMIGAIRPSKQIVKQSPRFGEEAAEAGLFGSLKTIKKKAQSTIDDLVPKVDEILRGKTGNVDALEIASKLDDLKNPYDDVLNKAISDTQEALIRNADDAGKISVQTAQQEKKFLYQALKDSQWGKGIGEVPAKATVRKGAAHGLKEGIEKVAPEVASMNKKIGTSVGALEGVSKQQEKNWYKPLIPFFETIGGVGGLATGNPWITMAILARRAAQSPMVLSRGAQALLNKPIGRAATIGATEAGRRFGG